MNIVKMNATDPRPCLPSADNAFGPIVSGACRDGFDFTLTFEQYFFSIVPSVLLLVVAPLRLWVLHGERHGLIVTGRKWRNVKLVSSCLLKLFSPREKLAMLT